MSWSGQDSKNSNGPHGGAMKYLNQRESVGGKIYRLMPGDVEGFNALAGLALDMRWSWNHGSEEIWRKLDPALWELTHNPWGILQTISRERLEQVLADPDFRKKVDDLIEYREHELAQPAWFQQKHPEASVSCIAYFCMEFMLSEALPIYSGGLGNVAGDQLKAASDLGVPVIGVGLLYSQGYFRQVLDNNGAQQALFPYNDPGQLPITPLRDPAGEWLRFKIALPGYSVWLRAWQARVGRTKLYLLDSNDAANIPAHRGITSELYGGGPELRLKQELLLGIGGWRLLAALGLQPQVCHLNEGHAAFAVLERAFSYMQQTAQPFEVALAVTRAGNIFTTHTAVAAGFDRFAPSLIEQYLGAYAEQKLGITIHDLLALGRLNPDDSSEKFTMAYLAIRGSGAVNGVSRLHENVSRHLFLPLFRQWPQNDIPVGHVTNGVHVQTWNSVAAAELWTEVCGKDGWGGTMETVERDIHRVSDARLWRFRTEARNDFIEYARERLSHQLSASGADRERVDQAKHIFDPDILTLGIARRFATYKRPNLLLHNPERLLHLLTNKQRPVQLVIAGKAHPADQSGQELIQEWTRFIERPEARPHVIFLSDYEMHLTGRMVQGVDVWINTPRRPWEACGTSGMKVLVNGGINLSELDGWWAEAYAPDVGWALGDGREHSDETAWDAVEADALYDLLERKVVPEYYTRDESGIPIAWVKRMRESMAQLTPRFSADRTVREYTEQHYIPAARAYHERIADSGAIGKRIVEWQHSLKQRWSAIHFGEVKVETRGNGHIFQIQVDLNNLDPDAVKVELYAEEIGANASVRLEMKRAYELAGESGVYVYNVTVSSTRPVTDYVARVIPHCDDIAIPLEEKRILWQR